MVEILFGVGIFIVVVAIAVFLLRGLFRLLKFLLVGLLVLVVGIHFFVMPITDVVDRVKLWKESGAGSVVTYDKEDRSFNVVGEGYTFKYMKYNDSHVVSSNVDLKSEDALKSVLGMVRVYTESTNSPIDVKEDDSAKFIESLENAGGSQSIGGLTFELKDGRLLIDGVL